MEKRKLGNSGIEVAPFTLGGNVFGWTIDEAASFQVLDAYLDAGYSLVDTADVYSRWKEGNQGGESETIIGNWVKTRKNRSQVIIATKVGGDMGEGKNLRKDYILKAAEASLKRLQTDYIDLYQSHWDDVNTPVEEALEAYAQLIKEGKVRAIGASNFSKERLAKAIEASERDNLPRYETFQPRYNLYDREEYEMEYEQLCLDKGLGVIPYYGLASGFLSGKYRSEQDLGRSARGGGVKKYLTEKGHRILNALDNVARRYNVPQATVAIAWLVARKSITAPIASATSTEQLSQLLQAVEVDLDEEAIRQLDEASS
ncbi:MAG TPA: aldo/keto reductase [Flavisolibacter sp.]|nr:aldo/keto reductase [Flavisolibacter sp.]